MFCNIFHEIISFYKTADGLTFVMGVLGGIFIVIGGILIIGVIISEIDDACGYWEERKGIVMGNSYKPAVSSSAPNVGLMTTGEGAGPVLLASDNSSPEKFVVFVKTGDKVVEVETDINHYFDYVKDQRVTFYARIGKWSKSEFRYKF